MHKNKKIESSTQKSLRKYSTIAFCGWITCFVLGYFATHSRVGSAVFRESTIYYFFSTGAQCCAAVVGLGISLAVFRLSSLAQEAMSKWNHFNSAVDQPFLDKEKTAKMKEAANRWEQIVLEYADEGQRLFVLLIQGFLLILLGCFGTAIPDLPKLHLGISRILVCGYGLLLMWFFAQICIWLRKAVSVHWSIFDPDWNEK